MSKSSFFIGQPIFSQVLKLLPRDLIFRVARDNKADHYCKRFTTYDHLVTMLYSVFNNCNSLREVSTGLLAWEQRLTHLGMKHYPRRSTISDANARRNADTFEQIYLKLLKRYSVVLTDSRGSKRDSKLYVFDSTTITLFQEVLRGAGMAPLKGKRKGGIKVHTLLKSDQDLPCMVFFSQSAQADTFFLKKIQLPPGSILVFDKGYNDYSTFERFSQQEVTWVTQLRKDAKYEVIENRTLSERQQKKGVVSDQDIILGLGTGKSKSKVRSRVITYYDKTSEQHLYFLTNNLKLAPGSVGDLYLKRWQIEVLFKRLKQNYPLKYFLGDSENAIKIQIWCSLIADLLLKIIKKSCEGRWSFSNLTSMIRLHLMTYIDLFGFLKCPEKALLRKMLRKEKVVLNGSLFPT